MVHLKIHGFWYESNTDMSRKGEWVPENAVYQKMVLEPSRVWLVDGINI